VRCAWLLVATGLLVAGCGSSSAGPTTTTTTHTRTFAGNALTPPRTAPPIVLRDAEGKPVTLAAQRGRYVLVTFLYTHCPDVCPLIAANLNQAVRQLGPSARDVRVLAVSVDPKGDTPAAVHAYTRAKHLVPQFEYLIGTAAQLRRVWAAYDVLAVSRKADLVDHIAYTALVDPSGRERVLYDAHVRARQVVHDLHLLMRREAPA